MTESQMPRENIPFLQNVDSSVIFLSRHRYQVSLWGREGIQNTGGDTVVTTTVGGLRQGLDGKTSAHEHWRKNHEKRTREFGSLGRRRAGWPRNSEPTLFFSGRGWRILQTHTRETASDPHPLARPGESYPAGSTEHWSLLITWWPPRGSEGGENVQWGASSRGLRSNIKNVTLQIKKIYQNRNGNMQTCKSSEKCSKILEDRWNAIVNYKLRHYSPTHNSSISITQTMGIKNAKENVYKKMILCNNRSIQKRNSLLVDFANPLPGLWIQPYKYYLLLKHCTHFLSGEPLLVPGLGSRPFLSTGEGV